MFADPLPDLAVKGETGIDVFHRQDLPAQRRSRFRCLGTVLPDERALVYEGDADAPRLTRAAAAWAPLPMDLTDAGSFPRAGTEALAVFQHIDFLRAFALADAGLSRFAATLTRGVDLGDGGALAAQAGAAYAFNRLGRGADLARAVLPLLPPPRACADDHAFALRMLGDLALRGGQAALALQCFEGALAIGANPHRRARALAAAQALGDADALARHGAPA